MSTIPARF
ncbi:hypothetical protein YPPY98_2624, partial [Yersinia pestis PY-98]